MEDVGDGEDKEVIIIFFQPSDLISIQIKFLGAFKLYFFFFLFSEKVLFCSEFFIIF
jgi:hypothetical protein